MECRSRITSITTIAVVLWHLGSLPECVSLTCKQTGACSCESPEGVIDLSPIGLKDGARFTDIATSPPGYLFYSWNPCFPFREGPKGAALCQNVAHRVLLAAVLTIYWFNLHGILRPWQLGLLLSVFLKTCLIVKSGSVSTYYAIGTQDSAKFVTFNGKPQIQYNFTMGLLKLTSAVHLECDESLDPGNLTIPVELNANIMYYKGRYACARSVEAGISAGSVILIILFVVVCLYLILGTVFQKFYRKESGIRVIPNSNVWFSLPGLIKNVLRMPEDTPAQRALEFALLGASKYRARRRRHCINLLSVLRIDLKKAGLGTLKSRMDLRNLRILAEDKTQWEKAKKED